MKSKLFISSVFASILAMSALFATVDAGAAQAKPKATATKKIAKKHKKAESTGRVVDDKPTKVTKKK